MQSLSAANQVFWKNVFGAPHYEKQPTSNGASSWPELFDSRGAHYSQGKTQFCVYAPAARNVECQLTEWGRVQHLLPMTRQSDGTWTVSTDQSAPGRTYTYRVTDCYGHVLDRVDPFSFGSLYVPEIDAIQSVVVDRGAFHWTDEGWCLARAQSSPLEKPLSIYEVHIKSWDLDGKKLREIAPKLAAYSKEMGFTHIELYGIMEHFWRDGRGYQVTNFFAPYHGAGSYDDLKYFVNYMHEQGLGVIVDWIPAHYDKGSDWARHRSTSMYQLDGTNLFGSEDSTWGTYFIDYSLPEARRLLEASAIWWLKEFHFDAIRADAVSQLVQRHGRDVPAGIDFLQKLNNKVHANFPGILMIAEATDWDPRVTLPTTEGGFGFDLNWGVGACQNMHHYLRTPDRERSYHHQNKLERIFHERKRIHEKTISTHSHDDSDSGADKHDKALFNLGSAHSNETERLADIRNFFGWQIFGPNWGHMLHMGDEFAQPETWYARFLKKLPGVQWECIQRAAHNSIKEFVKDSIHYYRSSEGFWRWGGANCEKIYSYAPNKIMAYTRGSSIVIHNFSKQGYNSYEIDLPARYKSLIERINSNQFKYGGTGEFLNDRVALVGNRLHVKLPPLSVVVLEDMG